MVEAVICFLTISGLLSGVILLWRIPYCLIAVKDTVSHASLSVIIPARNEVDTLPVLLGSIQSQDGIKVEVIVVDDHSTDETAAVAQSFGAVVIHSAPLPNGWTGKTWACFQGAEHANGEVLLFLDADTVIHTEGLRRMLATFYHECGALSIAPFHVTKKFHEQFSAIFNLVVMASVNAFSIFSSHRTPAGLFGPCLIISKTDYFRTGGHESVKGKILENFFMAETFKKNGVQMTCYGGKDVLSYRMYPHGIKQVIQGWSKVFASGASHTKHAITLLISVWFAGSLTAPLSILVAILVQDVFFMITTVVLYLVFVLEQSWILKRIGSFYRSTALFYPATVIFFLFVFHVSLAKTMLGRGVSWKGRPVNT